MHQIGGPPCQTKPQRPLGLSTGIPGLPPALIDDPPRWYQPLEQLENFTLMRAWMVALAAILALRLQSVQAASTEEEARFVAGAKAAGILVVSSSIGDTHGQRIQGLGRSPMADPDRFESFEPGLFWARRFAGIEGLRNTLFIPMDSRTTASCGGSDSYVFFRMGGWSWITPYLAGVYALAVQVDSKITPDEFLSLALNTGRTIQYKQNAQTSSLGPILDPVALIEALKSK